jgi:hypothetical protein
MAVNENINTNTQNNAPVPSYPPQVMPFMLQPSTIDKALDYGVKGIVIVGVLWGAKKIYDKIRHDAQEDKTGDDPATQQAMALRSAMNPSGFEWLKNADGTNEENIFSTAKTITDLNAVILAYRKLYSGASLMDDLKREMKPESFTRFNNTFKFKDTTHQTEDKKTVNTIARAKAKVNIRKTPRLAGEPHFWSSSNVIVTVDAGKAIGIATGRTVYDADAKPSGVKFVEVHVLKKDAAIKNAFTAWVAASQIDYVSADEYKKNKYPAISITQEQFDNATAPLNGTKPNNMVTANYKQEILTVTKAPVLNEKFEIKGVAEKNTILGFPVMELNTGKKIFIQFLTIDGTARWVNKEYVKMITKE